MCAVYDNGDMEVVHPNGFRYDIPSVSFHGGNDWPSHMREKNWVNMDDFNVAYTVARWLYGKNETATT